MKLNLGSGYRKMKGYENIDNREEVNPDVRMEIIYGLLYDDNSIDEVRAFDFLEHIPIDKIIFVIEEIYRVLKPDGKFEHFTPSTDGRGAFQDPTHKSFWNLNSWLYYMNDDYRNLYDIKAKFRGENQNVVTDHINKIIHVHGILYAIKEK